MIRAILNDFLTRMPVSNKSEQVLFLTYKLQLKTLSNNVIENFIINSIQPRKNAILQKEREAIMDVVNDLPFSINIDSAKYSHIVDYLVKIASLQKDYFCA